MPMNSTQLSVEMLAAIGGTITPERQAAFDALAQAIVAHIQANAQVAVTATATGVTAGLATAPVTGTGTIT